MVTSGLSGMSFNIIRMNDHLIDNTQQRLAEKLGLLCISSGKTNSIQAKLCVEGVAVTFSASSR